MSWQILAVQIWISAPTCRKRGRDIWERKKLILWNLLKKCRPDHYDFNLFRIRNNKPSLLHCFTPFTTSFSNSLSWVGLGFNNIMKKKKKNILTRKYLKSHSNSKVVHHTLHYRLWEFFLASTNKHTINGISYCTSPQPENTIFGPWKTVTASYS